MENTTKKEIKPWLFELSNGDYEVTTKDGVFTMGEAEYGKIRAARNRGTVSKRIEECTLSELVKAKDGKTIKIAELEFDAFKGSTVMRLMYVMNEVLGASDFLDKSDVE